MFYLEGSRFAYDCQDVEANRDIQAEVLDVGIGGYHNPPYFLPIDGILRLYVVRVAACLHFHDDQLFMLGSDNIQFQVVLAPVPVAYGVAVLFQMAAASSPAFPRVLCCAITLCP